MGHKVKCYYCGHTFDRDKEPFMAIPDKTRRYAHKECYLRAAAIQQADEENQIKLENYIKELFNYKVLPEGVKRQIREYISEKNYTYSGILKALKYFYEIKHGSKEKAYGRIGIVPFVYEDAHNYYLAVWQTQQKNTQKFKSEEYVVPEREVHISIPQREPIHKKRKIFVFLEEDVNEQ